MSVLHENILSELYNQCEHIGGETVYAIDDFKFPDLANAIENLFLTTHIEMLRELVGEMLDENEIYKVNLKIKLLLEQLTELNKIQ